MFQLCPTSIAYRWGSTEEDRRRIYPCDKYIAAADDTIYRAVTVDAPPATVFRWLCQLRNAPYSYDWIDNAGKQSPQTLTPGLEKLENGQNFMSIFTLIAFETNSQITLEVTKSSAVKMFGRIICTYAVIGRGDGSSRLVVKLLVQRPGGFLGFVAAFLPWGDLIMMRRQLLNLRYLAETVAVSPR